MNPSVAIIILNWNGWSDTVECLESVYQINYPNYHVVVVDNNSSNNSIQKIKEYADGNLEVKSKFFKYNSNNKPIKKSIYINDEFKSNINLKYNKQLFILKNEINYGFAEGNNKGIKFVLNNLHSDYILLLNNDTVVDENFLTSLVFEAEKYEKVGLVGPKMYYYNNPDIIWSIGGEIDWKFARGLHKGNNKLDKGQYEKKKKFDYINGTAVLIKREVIDKIGLLDKEFFLYFEEADLALRASQVGYISQYIPHAKIWHKVSKSGGGISKPIGLYYITRNRWMFMNKWAKKSDYKVFIVSQIIGAIIFPLILSIYYRNSALFRAYYSGLFDGIF